MAEYCEHNYPINSHCPSCAEAELLASGAIDLSRFHKGPMTEEQMNEHAGQLMLFLTSPSWESAFFGWVDPTRMISVHDLTEARVNPSSIYLWCPLPEVK